MPDLVPRPPLFSVVEVDYSEKSWSGSACTKKHQRSPSTLTKAAGARLGSAL